MEQAPADDFRDRFPVLEELDFLNHAAVAPLSGPAADALAAYAEQAARRSYHGADWYKRVEAIRDAAARLIHARGGHEIAFIPNTTTGLAQVARGLNWQRGDAVVITAVEYPANRYPWEHLARTRGVELIEVPQGPDARIDLDAVCDAVTDRTRVVSISHVQYASGHRIDLRPIADTVHAAGGYLCVDAIQSVGALPVDVRSMGIDFLSADGHKWMLGPEGAGIFYCHEDLAPLLTPAVVGWLSMEEAHDYGNYLYKLQGDARRFEPGSWNIPGILALGASLHLLLEVGIDNVWSRIDALCTRLCDGLTSRGYRIYSPRQRAAERSGIVLFEADVPADRREAIHQRLYSDLAKQNIIIAMRGGRLRVSPHFYNTPEQIDRLLDALPETP